MAPLLSVIDDDESVRESLPDLLRSFGFEAQPFASAEAFLASGLQGRTACLVLDVSMPGMSGPDLRDELARRRIDIPVVFITAHTDTETRRLGRDSATACLFKPFSDTALIEAVNGALNAHAASPAL